MGFKLQQNTTLKDPKNWGTAYAACNSKFRKPQNTVFFASKTIRSTFNKHHRNCTKTQHYNSLNQKIVWGGGTTLHNPTPFPRWDGDTPSPQLFPLGASVFAPTALELGAYGASFSSPPNFFYLAPPKSPTLQRRVFLKLNKSLLC